MLNPTINVVIKSLMLQHQMLEQKERWSLLIFYMFHGSNHVCLPPLLTLQLRLSHSAMVRG